MSSFPLFFFKKNEIISRNKYSKILRMQYSISGGFRSMKFRFLMTRTFRCIFCFFLTNFCFLNTFLLLQNKFFSMEIYFFIQIWFTWSNPNDEAPDQKIYDPKFSKSNIPRFQTTWECIQRGSGEGLAPPPSPLDFQNLKREKAFSLTTVIKKRRCEKKFLNLDHQHCVTSWIRPYTRWKGEKGNLGLGKNVLTKNSFKEITLKVWFGFLERSRQ